MAAIDWIAWGKSNDPNVAIFSSKMQAQPVIDVMPGMLI